jgi:hypothetical protein
MPKNTPNAKDSAGKAGASAILSADLTMQEERLLLEKLQLDNDEQRARISQLQLQWWQKPFGLLAMILPLVPLMATGVAAIASKWSESQRTAAEVARKEAELEKQGFELENKRQHEFVFIHELVNETDFGQLCVILIVDIEFIRDSAE